jgi:hypothetical protein
MLAAFTPRGFAHRKGTTIRIAPRRSTTAPDGAIGENGIICQNLRPRIRIRIERRLGGPDTVAVKGRREVITEYWRPLDWSAKPLMPLVLYVCLRNSRRFRIPAG